jgi:Ser/Thr protein kinase RdoA (MazF antagonist)
VSSGLAWDQSELIEYAPERSATVRVLDTHGQICGFAKAYRDRDALDAAEQFNRVAALVALLDGIRTPRALGWARPDRIVVLEAMRGRRWSQLPIEVQRPTITHLGAALANAHGLKFDFGRAAFQRNDSRNVLGAAALVTKTRPDLAEPARRLRDNLAKGVPSRGAAVCVHGDFHMDNVLFHSDEVHMIDFDRGGSGVASTDLGSMLASLMTNRLISPDMFVSGLGAAFLEGYSSIRPLPSTTELRWYTAAAFVAERAAQAIITVHVPTMEVLPEVLASAEAVLAGTVGLED